MKGFMDLLRNDPIILMLALAIGGLVFVMFMGAIGGCKSADMGKSINITLPNLTTEQIDQIGKWVKEVQDAKQGTDSGTNSDAPTTGANGTTFPATAESSNSSGIQPAVVGYSTSDGGGVSATNAAEYQGYKSIDRSDFNCCEMIPTYEQLMDCDTELLITCGAGVLSWYYPAGVVLTPQAGEEIKVVNIWFKDGKALLFKDWGVGNSPGADSRWYRNNDLRKDGRVINALEIPGAQFISCIVGTWQPRGQNVISRVIAKSRVITNG